MKLKKSLSIAGAIFAVCSVAPAQTARVAYVDIDRVTEKSDKINAAMGDVQTRVEKIQQSIEQKRSRIVELRTEVKKGEGVLADSELKKRRDEASKLEKELVDLEYEGKREMQKLDATLFEPMVKTIVLAIQDVAKEQNIDLVVRGEAVLYGTKNADITDAVVKKLNSPGYNPGSNKTEASKESTPSSKSVSATDAKESTESKASDSNSSKASEANSGDGDSKRSIFPSVPLVTRPVDRQPD